MLAAELRPEFKSFRCKRLKITPQGCGELGFAHSLAGDRIRSS